jgi:hypothetical protein
MRRHILFTFLALALPCALALGSAPATAQAAPATAQTTAAGVTVKVTPSETAAGAATWVFAVVLDTHSQELSDDLLRTTVLVTDDGRELPPSAWQGAAPGSHHREGKLEFPAPNPTPKSFVLRMQRPGEGETRLFRFAP